MAAYTDRTATTGDPIALTMSKLIDLPAYPDTDTSYATANFWSGQFVEQASSAGNPHSNKPLLQSGCYSFTGTPTGLISFGLSHADYAVRNAGTEGTGGVFFQANGWIDGMSIGLSWNIAADTTSLTFQRQVLGAFTGGTASPVAFDAVETQDIVWEHDLSSIAFYVMAAALDSTPDVPAALVLFTPLYDVVDLVNDKIGGLRVEESGTITRVGLFKTDNDGVTTQTDIGPSPIMAQCRDETYHYFVRETPDTTKMAFTRCVESAWDSFSYTNYTPLFDDPDLPATLASLRESVGDYTFTAMYGTDAGFLISYKKLGVPKFVLIDREWTTVQHITVTAGDATASSILTQGLEIDGTGDISMMAEGGYAWLLGGTPAAPLVVESVFEGGSGGSGGDGGDGLQDTSVRLRVWGFSLDGHDYYVLRVGPSESLVYDLTTGTWSSWASPGRDNWRAHVGQNWIGMSSDTLERGFGSDIVAGDDASGVLWVLDPTMGRDDRTTTGSDPFNRIVTGGLSLSGREVAPCGALQLDYSTGNPSQTGATFTLETSDDWGNTFDSHGTVTVSADDFSGVVEWRALGQARAPGRVFRITDNGAAVRISGADLR